MNQTLIVTFILFINCSTCFTQSKHILSQKDAVDIALKNNPEMKMKEQSIIQEKGKFFQSLSLPKPNISVRYEAVPDGAKLEDADNRKIFFVQSFDFPTKYILKNQMQSIQIKAVEEEYNLAKNKLIQQVKIAYNHILQHNKKLELAKRNLKLMEDFAQKAELKYKVGEGTYLEFLQAKVKKGEAQNEMTNFRILLEISHAQLKLLLFEDKDYPTDLVLRDSLIFMDFKLSLENLTENALEFNPELAIAKIKHKSSNYNKKLAYSSFLPDFAVNYFRMKIGSNPNFWGIDVRASIPLWFLFDQRGKIQEKRAENRHTHWEMKNKEEEIKTEVKNRWLTVRSIKSQVYLYQNEILKTAEEVYRTASRSYEEGEIGYIELIQAQRTLITAQSGYIDVLFNFNQAIVDLELIVGKEIME